MSFLSDFTEDPETGTTVVSGASGFLQFEQDGSPATLDLVNTQNGVLYGILFRGEPGPSAYDVAVANGFVGSPVEWLASLLGSSGDDGKSVELRATGTALQWRQVGGSWADLVLLADLKGSNGTDGKSVELQKTATAIQSRQTGGSWSDLVLLSALMGADGKSVELQKTGTAIQWRQAGGTWADLVQLADLKGSQGNQGPTGSGFLVLGPSDAVPGGTPAGTAILRRTV